MVILHSVQRGLEEINQRYNESVNNLPKITAAMLKILNDLNLKEPLSNSSLEDDYL